MPQRKNNKKPNGRGGANNQRGKGKATAASSGASSLGSGGKTGNNSSSRGALTSGGTGFTFTRVSEPWMPLFPATIVRRLRYSATGTLSCSAGVPAWYVMRANDLQDPDFTSTGHQPMGFDQMMLNYNHFCVMKARLVVTFKNTGSTIPTCVIRQDASSTTLSVIDQIKEFGGLTMDALEGKGVYGANKTLDLAVDIAKLQGVSRKALTADPTLRGDASTSPTEVTYFHFGLWDSSAASGSCNWDLQLEQEAHFMEPRDLVESLHDRLLHAAKCKFTPVVVDKPLPDAEEEKKNSAASSKCEPVSFTKPFKIWYQTEDPFS